MGIRKDTSAQAALVDSLFFIAIVSAICTGLFYFAINYGLGPERLLNSFYSSDFAMDSLKVITYINIMRDGSSVSLNPTLGPDPYSGVVVTPEYDYLLALLKEDFAQNKSIGYDSRKAISNTLYSVLKPFDDSIDYVFFIAKESYSAQESKFVALIIASRKKVEGTGEAGVDYIDPDTGESFSVNRVFYSCDPTNKAILEKYIYPYIGKVDSAIGKITLSAGDLGSSSPYIIGLSTWISKDINIMSNLDVDPNFNCKLIEGVPALN
jgi:hypothetical protein